jgi:hypothetical protein
MKPKKSSGKNRIFRSFGNEMKMAGGKFVRVSFKSVDEFC